MQHADLRLDVCIKLADAAAVDILTLKRIPSAAQCLKLAEISFSSPLPGC